MLDNNFLGKVTEITRLHDEAFNHYQKFDQHAKISDGTLCVEINFGNVHERANLANFQPGISLSLYSYVVATPREYDYSAPTYYFGDVDEALDAMRLWHNKAMLFNPTEEEQLAWQQLAEDLITHLKESGKLTVIDIANNSSEEPAVGSDNIVCNLCNTEINIEQNKDCIYYCNCGRVAIEKVSGYSRILGYPGDII